MTRKSPFCHICLLSTLILAVLPQTAWADTRTKITSIPLEVYSTIEAGYDTGHVDVSTDADDFTVDDITILNDNGDWKGNDRPRVSVYLLANDDYYFSSTSKKVFSFYGDQCTFVSAKRRDSGTGLDLVFKLGKIGSGDLTIDGLEWDPSSGIASWDEVPGANSYQIQLYRAGKTFSGIKSTSNKRYNFSSLIDQQGTYYFEVRAVGTNSAKGDWAESEEGYISTEDIKYFRRNPQGNGNSDGSNNSGPGVTNASSGSVSGPGVNANNSSSGTWQSDQIGWRYALSTGVYAANNWLYINDKWYYFNQYGYMSVGWINWNQNWYYCGADGSMYTNCRTPDNYYVGGTGAWIP